MCMYCWIKAQQTAKYKIIAEKLPNNELESVLRVS